jgi:hypothetical protein
MGIKINLEVRQNQIRLFRIPIMTNSFKFEKIIGHHLATYNIITPPQNHPCHACDNMD